MWTGDDPHLNTMVSPDRSDIGAAVASAKDEWGSTVYYFVLETAMRTSSGQMQYDAFAILTTVAAGQAAYAGGTPGISGALPEQYIVPVGRSTARPDGDVIHKVQYGQSLWSIAVVYGTTIKQIRLWNNLADDAPIYTGQKLLVQKGATQPAPASATPAASPRPTMTGTAPTAPALFNSRTGTPTDQPGS